MTPLHLAADTGSIEVLAVILGAKGPLQKPVADVNFLTTASNRICFLHRCASCCNGLKIDFLCMRKFCTEQFCGQG